MGDYSSYGAAALRWAEVCADPVLRNLPYKIELNTWGKIEMSPASNRHGRLQAEVAYELRRQLPDGVTLTEGSIHTDIGVRVPDVMWGSREFFSLHGESTPWPRAPEICIEIISPSNTAAEVQDKTRAYLAAGAIEVWHVDESGAVRFFDASGHIAASRFPVTLALPAPHP